MQQPSTTTSIHEFATQLAGTRYWLCVIYAKGIYEDERLETLCAEIGDLQETGGLCIVANVEDATTMSVLSDTVEVANTYDAPIFSISLGEELPAGAVASASHYHVVSSTAAAAGGGGHGGDGGDQYSFVVRVLSEILKVLKERRGQVG